jgi:hypothetical protein
MSRHSARRNATRSLICCSRSTKISGFRLTALARSDILCPRSQERTKAQERVLVCSNLVTARDYFAKRYRCEDRLIRKSSNLFPDRSCTVSQRGCFPRPAHVSAGFFGFRYFGRTLGYGRRLRSGLLLLAAAPSVRSRYSRVAFSAFIFRLNSATTSS